MPNGEFFSEYDFDKLQAGMATVDSVMRALSIKYKMKLQVNYRGYWPSRRLWKGKWLKSFALSISLDPESNNKFDPMYILDETVFFNFILPWKVLDHRMVAKYTVKQINDRELIEKVLETLINQRNL